MEQTPRITAMEFASMARSVGELSRRRGLRVPGFRTPPHVIGSTRTVQRLPGGAALVSVAVTGRTEAAVCTDLVDGVILVNDIRDGDAETLRRSLLSSLLAETQRAA